MGASVWESWGSSAVCGVRGEVHLKLDNVLGLDAALVGQALLRAVSELVLPAGARVRSVAGQLQRLAEGTKWPTHHDFSVPAGVADADAHALTGELQEREVWGGSKGVICARGATPPFRWRHRPELSFPTDGRHGGAYKAFAYTYTARGYMQISAVLLLLATRGGMLSVRGRENFPPKLGDPPLPKSSAPIRASPLSGTSRATRAGQRECKSPSIRAREGRGGKACAPQGSRCP